MKRTTGSWRSPVSSWPENMALAERPGPSLWPAAQPRSASTRAAAHASIAAAVQPQPVRIAAAPSTSPQPAPQPCGSKDPAAKTRSRSAVTASPRRGLAAKTQCGPGQQATGRGLLKPSCSLATASLRDGCTGGKAKPRGAKPRGQRLKPISRLSDAAAGILRSTCCR